MESGLVVFMFIFLTISNATLLVGQDPFWLSNDQKEILKCEELRADATVAGDGSGDYRTIKEAVASIPSNSNSRYIIHVKEGLYRENVIVARNNVVMFGDGNDKTVVVGNLSRVDNPDLTTFQTATFAVLGNNFVVKDMKFVNLAGPEKHQAVAFHAKSSHSVMYQCSFQGFQDTLYAHAGEQLYLDCEIVGTVDFICGNAAAVFQNCTIWALKPLPEQVVTVTAQAAFDRKTNSGFSIIRSKILPLDEGNFTVYLGRPWRSHATVVVMETELGEMINPSGWLAWNSSADPPPSTVNFGEYHNYGPGSSVTRRVRWVGYKPVMTDEEAIQFTVDAFINREGWLQRTCIPYNNSM